MQQFLFTSPTPDRDSSIDGDVVFHEYGHGISNRLIGNGSTALSGTQSGAMGEGWSDYWAITINNDGAVGEYVTNNPAGIRRAAYTVPAAAVHNSYSDLGFGVNAAWRRDNRPHRAQRDEVHAHSSIIPERTRRHNSGRSEPEWRSKSLHNLDSVCTSRHGRVGGW
jgi:hypothetical protein